ncbi:MAG: glycosyltransferase family 4 protein [Candidatus Wallbacteria bacterium]|nr:glycosyltransferase family 4 protein [Candidatus Wallbacteria bacterium]
MRKIKVLHIITRLILGGAQENTLLTIEGLQKTDRYDVRLLTGPLEGPEDDLLAFCREHEIHYTVFSQLQMEINPFKDLITLFELYFFLRKNKFDIVHTHSAKTGIIGRLAAKMAGVPIRVHTIHGLPFHPYQSEYLNQLQIALEKSVAGITDLILCVAKAMIDKSVQAGIAGREKFYLVRSGFPVDPYLYAKKDEGLARRLGIEPEDVVIGKVARLYDLKGHKYLISAFREVLKKIPSARLLLVGDGILRDALTAQAEELGVLSRVIFAGEVPNSEIQRYIALMDLLVHASLREGLAKILPQALLMGKPVVSFDIDGASEIIVDHTTGLLTPPENVEALIDALIFMMENKAEASMMAIRGRKLALSLFPVERMVNQIDELYLHLLNAKAIHI